MHLTKQCHVDNKLCLESEIDCHHSYVGHLVSFPSLTVPFPYRSSSLILMWVTQSHSQSHSHVGHPVSFPVSFSVSFPVSFSCGSPSLISSLILSLIPSLILMRVTQSHSREDPLAWAYQEISCLKWRIMASFDLCRYWYRLQLSRRPQDCPWNELPKWSTVLPSGRVSQSYIYCHATLLNCSKTAMLAG